MNNVNDDLATLTSREKRAILAQLLAKRAAQPVTAAASFAQERMWIVEQLNPGSAVLHLPMTLRLKGVLDGAALARALDEIVMRHGVLRTAFMEINGQPTQVITPNLTCPLRVVDVMHLAPVDCQVEVERLIQDATKQPFDLTAAPLLRVVLVRLGEMDHLLHFVLHHIVCDGWSMTVLAHELSALYNAYTAGQPSPLPKLPIQYAEFAHWQRERMQGEVLAGEVAYWQQQLQNSPPLLELPTDRPRPSVRTFHGQRVSSVLSADLVKTLKTVGRHEGATLFMTLLAAYQLLLSRHSGLEDVVVGTPVAGRVRAEFEGLIGVFINNLVLRTDLTGQPSFRELLKRVRAVSLQAQAHQEVPFEKIVEVMQPERALSHTPLFQVMFNMLNFESTKVALAGLDVSFDLPPDTGANFDMTLYAVEREGRIELSLVYDAGLFGHARMVELLNQYRHLLQQVAAQPDRDIGEFSLVTAESRHLLADPTETLAQPFYPPVPHVFLEWAHASPEQPAVCQRGQAWTYAELEARARTLVGVMQERGVMPGDVVAVTGTRSCEFVAAMLAVLMNGGILLTLDRKLPVARQKLMLQHAACRHVMCAGEPRAQDAWLSECLTTVIHLTAAATADSPREARLPELQPGDAAYIFFTSGTTGVPKGILGRHGGLSHFLAWQRNEFAVGPGDRSAQLTGLSFDVVLRDVFLALTSGATLCLPDDPDDLSADWVLPWMEREHITLLHTVPALAQAWLARRPDGVTLPSLRQVFFAGEPLTGSLVRQWRAAFPSGEIANFYGPTETTLAKCCYRVPHGKLDGVQPVGWPLPSTQVLVLVRHDRLCGIGEAGEIVIRTPFRTRGYLNASLEDQQRFAVNPFCPSDDQDLVYFTGDGGRYRPDGAVEILGRLDDQVKIRGMRIEPAEINAVLEQHPSVRESVVLARQGDHAHGDKYLVAYVVASGQPAFSARELRQFLRERLPDYMVPSHVVSIDAIPLNANSKVDRRALPAPAGAPIDSPGTHVGPRTAIEDTLVDIWSEVLRHPVPGVHDNFFELGGHSLMAAQVMSRVRQVCLIDLPMHTLFEAPTVAGMAEHVEAALTAGDMAHAPPLLPVGRQAPLPLSFSQERMWFIHQLQPDSSAYHIAPAARLKGPFDLAAFERSLTEVIRRHEGLRTVFQVVDGQPVQVITPQPELCLRAVDLRDTPGPLGESRALALARQEAQRPFDLAAGPLMRVTVYRLSDDEHLVHNVMHHIISDAWSLGVLMRELATLYNAFVSGAPAVLPELEIQYGDFAHWQRQWMQGDELERQLAYWRRQLAGAAVLDLPTDRPRPSVQTTRGAIQSFDLPDALVDGLRQLSRKRGVTLFMTALAAFKVLLYRYTSQTDVVVGVPIANRRWLAVENLIGTFVNTLALRTDLSGNPTFNALLDRERNVALEAFAHQDISFAKLVAELQPERDTSHAPLFQVMFNVINVPVAAPNMTGIDMSYAEVDRGGAQFDLSCTLTDMPDLRRVAVSYNTDLFDDETITRFMGHYVALLEGIAAAPDSRLHELPILPNAERHRLLREWNDTRIDYPLDRCVHHLFEAQAERTPGAIAVVGHSLRGQAQTSVTYDELNRQANQLAHYLRHLGVAPGTTVGISLERTTEMVIGLLGILKAGGTYVPLDPSFPRERLAFMLQDTQAPVLITQRSLLAELPHPQHSLKMICLDGDWETIAREPSDTPPDGTTASDLAYVLFTSGSTGKPKGVQIPHRALTNFLLSMQEAPGIRPEDVLLSVTTLSFDIAGLELYLPLITGARVVVASREVAVDGVLLIKALEQQAATVMQATPATWRMLLESGWKGTPGLKVLCGGEALSRDLADQLLARGASVWNLYGPTETTVWSTLKRILPGQPVTIGRPIANTRVYILDANLQLAPAGVPGNLHIGGAGVARGYLNRPELTSEKFLPDPFDSLPGARMYRTDDLTRFLPDGEIEHLGRLDHQVKVRGYRIELEEIEVMLRQHPSIQQAVVVARRDKSGEQQLIAYVIAGMEQAPSAGELRSYLKTQLPDYMLPSAFMFVQDFPLTPNRKVDRRALPDPNPLHLSAGREYVAPRNATEVELVRLWEELLGVPRVGVTDNFFDLGGHSLLTVRLFASIEQVFAVRLPLAMIFQSGTVEHLAIMISQQSGQIPWPSLVPIQPRGSKPPLFFVHPFAGDVIGFKVWADHLGDDQPFYGLRAKGLDGVQKPFDRIEDMAAHYIREMKLVQPEGPYYLGGYCAGSPIVFEMAQQLYAEGEQAALVALINQAPPHSDYYRVVWRPGFLADFLHNLPYWATDFAQLSPKEMWSRIRRRLTRDISTLGKRIAYRLGRSDAGHGDGSAPMPYAINQSRQFLEAFRTALDHYYPKVYPGRITVFRTRRQPLVCSFDPQMCWGQWTSGGIDVKLIPGSNTTILKDPYAREFTQQLRAAMDCCKPDTAIM